MKKKLFLWSITSLLGLLYSLSGCSNPQPKEQELRRSAWHGWHITYGAEPIGEKGDEEDIIRGETPVLFLFNDKTSGSFTFNSYSFYSFDYTYNGREFTFRGDVIRGSWDVLEFSRKKLLLSSKVKIVDGDDYKADSLMLFRVE